MIGRLLCFLGAHRYELRRFLAVQYRACARCGYIRPPRDEDLSTGADRVAKRVIVGGYQPRPGPRPSRPPRKP